MGTTANYAFPYPELTDPPNGPAQIQALAVAVDTALDGVDDAVDLIEATRPQGIIRRARRVTASSGSASSTAVAVLRLDSIPLVAGRSYTVTTGTIHPTSTITTDTIRVEIRFSTAGTATTASAVLTGAQAFELFGNTSQIDTTYVPVANQTMSLLLCVARESGTGTASIFADATRIMEIKMIDNGVDPGDTGVDL